LDKNRHVREPYLAVSRDLDEDSPPPPRETRRHLSWDNVTLVRGRSARSAEEEQDILLCDWIWKGDKEGWKAETDPTNRAAAAIDDDLWRQASWELRDDDRAVVVVVVVVVVRGSLDAKAAK
jgi:hypothetical protein